MERLRLMSIVETVRSELTRFGLLRPDAALLCAVSGGPDSMALLHVLHSLRAPFTLICAHFNHKIRESAGRDADFVRETCHAWGIEFILGEEDVPKYAKKNKLSLETAARDARYAFLRSLAASRNAEIALAHHMGDQVETLLMHMLRGSSLSGLCGMRAHSGGLFRPLLGVSRAEIEAYCLAHGVPSVFDETNAEMDAMRNRVRHELLPILRRYNPAFDSAALRLMSSARRDCDALDALALNAFRSSSREVPGGVALDVHALSELPSALSSRVLLLAAQAVSGTRLDFEFSHVEALLALPQKPSGAQLDLPNDIFASNAYSDLLILRRTSYIFDLPLNSVTATPLGTFTLSPAQPADVSGEHSESGDLGNANISRASCLFASIPAARLDSLRVRTRLPGDWMRPKGLGGRKKLQDIFVDKKIPRAWRDLIPLIAFGSEILWIPGLCSCELDSDEVLFVSFVPGSMFGLWSGNALFVKSCAKTL